MTSPPLPDLPGGLRRDLPTVSVVVVNLNGEDLLGPCLSSLRAQGYPPEKLEIILIDNASTDGSVAMVREQFPEVRVVVNDTNVGFSPAVNDGARLANGEYLALINNDAQADEGWIAEAVAYLLSHPQVGCAASLIIRDDRETIDYAGGELSFVGMGYNRGSQQPLDAVPTVAEPTLFASGGALVMPTEVFLDVGGFDAGYFAFFEDVDLGWRLWVLGHEVHIVPASRVFHRHHGTIKRFGYARERYLLERNALMTIFKNYDDEMLARTLPGAVILSLMRGLSDIDPDRDGLPDMAITPGATNIDDEDFSIPAVSAAHLAALRDFGRAIPQMHAKRSTLQSRRVRGDAAILPLFRKALQANVHGPEYLEVFEAIVDVFDLEEMGRKQRVLIVTEDSLGERMAGPAIRTYEMATVMARAGLEVTLVSTTSATIGGQGFAVRLAADPGSMQANLQRADVVVIQGFVMHAMPVIAEFDGPLVVDLYDPFHFEGLTQRKHDLDYQRFATHNSDTDIVNTQLQRGDFFVCASEKQRDLWLGQLAGVRRINPSTFDQDESLRALIDICPFGIPGEDPVRTSPGHVLRGVRDGIGEDDFLLVWGGGIYNWFDPLTLIRAVGRAAEVHDDIKLWFMGHAHPNPMVPKMIMASKAYNLAAELGLLDTHVFFNDEWVPYAQRQDYLLEADLGVSTHYEHLETRFSFRTRVLDYLWCELPVLSTEGDTLSQTVAQQGMGLSFPPEDVEACAAAILRYREDVELMEASKRAIREAKPGLTWERSLAPLTHFCLNPRRAADATSTHRAYTTLDRSALAQLERPSYDSMMSNALQFQRTIEERGVRTALEHTGNVVRQKLSDWSTRARRH